MAGVAAATSVLLLTGCGGSSIDKAGDGELTTIKIATQPIVDSAPLYLGKEKGFFAAEGIDLKIDSAVGGAAVVPGVVSGNLHFGRGNLLSTMVANDKGLDLQCVTNANSATGDPDFGAVVVPKDSPIKTIADLPGHKVSVNTFNNIGDTTIRSVVEEADGDPKGVQFVEIPFSDAPAALEKGQVDAAWILEPFLTEAKDHGARVLSYNFTEFHPELDISCVFTTRQMIEREPDLVKRFQAAMNKSLEYSQQHEDEVRKIVGTYTNIEPAVLERIVLPKFRVDFNREAAAKLGQLGHKYGTLSKEPDLDKLLP
ncbi:ABC transporter substrate-binding protein [Micromonospora sp. NPDC005087]|uniref:ABC transporter substrate-binding protein n=1 Tax=Micromonospora sp. NPDC005087 TaxID=3364225 RepID=UPI0036CB9817